MSSQNLYSLKMVIQPAGLSPRKIVPIYTSLIIINLRKACEGRRLRIYGRKKRGDKQQPWKMKRRERLLGRVYTQLGTKS